MPGIKLEGAETIRGLMDCISKRAVPHGDVAQGIENKRESQEGSKELIEAMSKFLLFHMIGCQSVFL